MFKLIIVFLISLPAFASEFRFERQQERIQGELDKFPNALRRDVRARLPRELVFLEGDERPLPEQASCDQALDQSYIDLQLRINRKVLDIMGSDEFTIQRNGCSHRLAFFFALKRILPNHFTDTKRDIPKRSFTAAQLGVLAGTIDSIINDTHIDLRKKKPQVALYPIGSDEFFMVSNFKVGRIVGKHRYRIGVNPKVFALDIPQEAVKGILAHELQHTEDYATGSFVFRIIPIGIKLLMKKHRYRYERRTDLKTLLKGYGDGLVAYKRWQYRLLSPADLIVKQQNYLTPGEIELIQSHLPKDIDRVRLALRGRMPKNIDEWREFLIE